jgi:hypothetical protein
MKGLAEQRREIAEEAQRGAELRAAQERAWAALARRQAIENRRSELRVRLGWDREDLVQRQRDEISARLDAQLLREFPPEEEGEEQPSKK